MDSGGLRELLQLLRVSSQIPQDSDLANIKEMEKTMKILSTAKFNQVAEDKPSLIKLNNLQDKLKAEVPDLRVCNYYHHSMINVYPVKLNKILN